MAWKLGGEFSRESPNILAAIGRFGSFTHKERALARHSKGAPVTEVKDAPAGIDDSG
ncbi:MAG: hypothetical protein MJ025_03620 [Victivallaceae bacterium]|nr:hypothetical protein [Victivallaceae bacterium]